MARGLFEKCLGRLLLLCSGARPWPTSSSSVPARPPRDPEMLRGGDKASRAPPPSPWLRSLPQSLSLSVFPTRDGNPSLRRRPPLTPFSSAPFKSLQQEASPRSPLRPHQTELAGTPSPRRNRRLFAATPTGPHRRCRRRAPLLPSSPPVTHNQRRHR